MSACVFRVRERWVEELQKSTKVEPVYFLSSPLFAPTSAATDENKKNRCADGNELLIDHIIVGGRELHAALPYLLLALKENCFFFLQNI